MKRRTAIGILAGGLASTSGCLGFITGSNSLAFEAEDVRVSESARSEAGYSGARDEPFTNTQTFSVAGQTREVEVTNHLAEYERTVSLPVLGETPLARFSVIASPPVKVAEQTLNPLDDYSNRELAMQFQERWDTIDDVQHVEDRSVSALGESRSVSKFEATATLESGEEVEVYMHISKFQHEEDFLVAVGTYPRNVDGEQAKVDTLIAGLEHPV